MTPNEKEVLAGIIAQANLSVKYVTDIVTTQVKDTVLAKSLNDAITVKLNTQRDAFSKAVEAEDDEVDLGSDLLA